ncbi:MAG TPA: RHS repeat domain-containing protein [Chitinophaga sp.]|uniref:RHS repeat domain-containing protein n=1 Tax=Chitinophaga sp. TaxID=1869181 RepID=UPI002DB84B3D|nr:RHS repeat domain-containing protein [Chitinophaga sp.]HEU4551944.1 RHS repeat domain-containing protein [Chitinophaga sp.]
MSAHTLYQISKHKVTALLTAVLLAAGSTGFAQEQAVALEKYAPPSPNAAELGKYATYPVGTVTGTPEISYNLFTIQSGELSLPVTLSYHASGIKVNQMASWVGLGWALNAGGVISRTIFGKKDEGGNGFMSAGYHPPRGTDLSNDMSYDALNRYYLDDDLEPDLFVYTAGSKNGKFIYTREKKFMTIPYAPIKISFAEKPNTIDDITFEIVDDDGTIYQFKDLETTMPQTAHPLNDVHTASWYLTYMISASRRDTISFTYTINGIDSYVNGYSYTVGQGLGGGCSSNTIQSSSSASRTGELQLNEITFKEGKLVFERNDPLTLRKDGGGYKLEHITEYSKRSDGSYEFVKQVNFLQSYFQTDPFYDSRDYYRLKLDGLNYTDEAGNIEKKYKFEYNSTPLPPYNSTSQDYFGFYNAKSNTTLIPHTHLERGELGASFGAYGANAGTCAVEMDFGDADREPDADAMKAAMLEKVTYPTGGYSVFDFEPHHYRLKGYPVDIKHTASVPRVIGVNLDTKQEATTTFSNAVVANAKMIIHFSPTVMSGHLIPETQQVILKDVTAGENVKTWTHNDNYSVALDVNEEFTMQATHTYELDIIVYGEPDVYVDARVEWTEHTLQDIEKIGGGLRIKSIKNYGYDNKLLNQEWYTYGENEEGLGEPIFDYDYFAKSYVDAMSEHTEYDPGAVACQVERAYYRTYQGVADNTTITYNGSPVLYWLVTKYNGTPDNNIGKTEYYYNINKGANFVPHTFRSLGNYGSLDNAWYQGDLRQEITYKNSGGGYTPVMEKNYTYQRFDFQKEYAVVLRKFCETSGSGPTGCTVGYIDGRQYFAYYEYSIATGINKMVSEETRVYDQANTANSILTRKEYTYDNTSHYYPVEIISADSKGKIIRQLMKYPADVAGSDPVLNRMLANNMISKPVESYRYWDAGNSNKLVFSEKNMLQSWNNNDNLVRPFKKEVSYGNTASPITLEYHAYDDRGNVTEQSKANDVNEVYLWGYNNQYPVAKIVGTTYTAAAALVDPEVLQHPGSDQQLKAELDNLRTALAGQALVITYTYKPLVGVTSETDPTGKTTYYEYDSFGRLKLIRDKDQHIIKTFDYHYIEL